MARILRRALFAAAWLFIAWFLSHVVSTSSLSPATRTNLAFLVIAFLGFTSTILAEALVEKRVDRESSPYTARLWPWGLGGTILGLLAMLLISRSQPAVTSQFPAVQTLLFGTLVGLWIGLTLGLGFSRRLG